MFEQVSVDDIYKLPFMKMLIGVCTDVIQRRVSQPNTITEWWKISVGFLWLGWVNNEKPWMYQDIAGDIKTVWQEIFDEQSNKWGTVYHILLWLYYS